MLRLTTMPFRGVQHDLGELDEAIGAKPGTILRNIELPAATPMLLVGLNQRIPQSLAMVCWAPASRGLTRTAMGLRAGLAIVATALLAEGCRAR